MSRPVLRKLEYDVRDRGGDQVIFDRVASGERIADIAADYGISRNFWYTWLKQQPDRRAKWDEAMTLRADVLFEQAGDLLENADPNTGKPRAPLSNSEGSWLKHRADRLEREAKMLNPEKYGDRPAQISLGLDFGSAFLDSLSRLGKAAIPADQIEDADYALLAPGD